MPKQKEKLNIPKGWSAVSLEDIVIKMKAGGTPSSQNKDYYGGGIPFVKIDDMTSAGKYITQTKKSLTNQGVENSSSWLIPKESLLYSIYATLGEVSINKIEVTTNQAIMGIVPMKEKVDRDYLYYYLVSIKNSLDKLFKETTQKNLSSEIVRTLPIILPQLPEQQKIAEILNAADEAIQKTEEMIAKTEELKRGLMQELLTHGIGHLKFKRTKLGGIPAEWQVVLIDSVAKRGSGHTPSKAHPEYWNGGIKWVSLADSKRLDDRYIFSTDKEISQQGIDNSSAVLHKKGSVIISRDAGIGKSAILSTEMAVSQHFIVWECGVTLDNIFLYYLLQLWKKRFEAIATGTTIKTIGLQYFKDLLIPLPPLPEQKKISELLNSIDDKISANKKLLAKQLELKRGLMQDLLSGRVRVK